jgi:hypothetical protein
MTFRKILIPALLSASLMMASTAFASIVESDKDISSIIERQREIAEQVRRSPKAMTEQQQRLIGEEQAKIYAIVEGKSSFDELNQEQKVRLVNAIEKIDAIVEATRAAEDSRMVCRRERTVGSNMQATRCAPRKQRQEETTNARNAVEQSESCLSGSCNSP